MAEQGYIIDYKVAVDEFCRFMQRNGNNFVPSLYERLDFVDYYNKITNNELAYQCYIKSGFTLIDYKSMNNYNRYHLIKVL